MRRTEVENLKEELSVPQRWDVIMEMVKKTAISNPAFKDIGLKKQGGSIYYEFSVDGQSFMILTTNI